MLHTVINRGISPCACDLEGDIEIYLPDYDLVLTCYYQASLSEISAELPLNTPRLADLSVCDASIAVTEPSEPSIRPLIRGNYLCHYEKPDGTQWHMIDAVITLDVDDELSPASVPPQPGDYVKVEGQLFLTLTPKANQNKALFDKLNIDSPGADRIASQAADILTQVELEIRFYQPDNQVLAELRDMVLWLKNRIPSATLVPSYDNQSLSDICRYAISNTQAPIERVVQHAIDSSGFGDDSVQLSYPNSLSTEELQEFGIANSNEVILISYWVGGFSDVTVPLAIYLRVLAEYLRENELVDLLAELEDKLLVYRPFNTRTAELLKLKQLIPTFLSALPYSESVRRKQLHSQLTRLQEQLQPHIQKPHNKLGHVRWYQLW